MTELLAHEGWTIGVVEAPADPVVDDFDNWQSILHTPGHLSMFSTWIVFGAENCDVVPPRQLQAEVACVDLGSRLVTRQEVVNGVENSQPAPSGHRSGNVT
jgi:hypothetical protein